MRVLENITYDELQIEDYATFTKNLSDENLLLFAANTGDLDVSSLCIDSAIKVAYDDQIGFGNWAASLISTAFEKVIPGPGSIYVDQDLSFHHKVERGDTLTVKLTVHEKQEHHRVIFQVEVKNQEGECVIDGTSTVIAPVEKISIEPPKITKVDLK